MEYHNLILQPLYKLHGYFEYLPPKNEMKDLRSAKQWFFAGETANGKITAPLVNAKRVRIPALPDNSDYQIQDKVRSIIKAKIDGENNTQDEEGLLPGN